MYYMAAGAIFKILVTTKLVIFRILSDIYHNEKSKIVATVQSGRHVFYKNIPLTAGRAITKFTVLAEKNNKCPGIMGARLRGPF